jgi:TadE-like protein
MTSRHVAQASGEEGAVLVETALVIVVLVTLVFGIVDYTLAWRDRMSGEAAARAGARTASGLGNERYADYSLLQSVRSALATVPSGGVDRIVVFNANSSGSVPETCKAGTAQNGVCNVYSAADLALTLDAFAGTTSCSDSAPDRFWCPTSRSVSHAAGTDYLGLWIQLHRDHMTMLFPGQMTIRSSAVMRLEPAGS